MAVLNDFMRRIAARERRECVMMGLDAAKQRIKAVFLEHAIDLDGYGRRLDERQADDLAEELCETLLREWQEDVPTVKDRAGLRFVLDPWSWDETSGCTILHVMTWGGNRWMYVHEIPFPVDDCEAYCDGRAALGDR